MLFNEVDDLYVGAVFWVGQHIVCPIFISDTESHRLFECDDLFVGYFIGLHIRTDSLDPISTYPLKNNDLDA